MRSRHDTRRSESDRWMDQAACRDKPARWFTDPTGPDDTRQALKTCARCPVRGTCLAVALNHPVDADVGVWGGTTEQTRLLIRRRDLDASQVLHSPPALAASLLHRPQTRAPAATTALGPISRKKTEVAPRRLEAPEITVARDSHGDYVDATGRVIIFHIHGDPPWMLMIDRRCIARTRTMAEARRVAWSTLHPSPNLIASRAVTREPSACRQSRR